MDYTPEDVGSKPTTGIFHFPALQKRVVTAKRRQKHSSQASIHRSGAEAARGAHNPEDIGSNPISGIVKLDTKQHPLPM
jgi:hypothetical protein